ncbi:hypothetical protein CIB48_g11417 [Xylaria polymorpha]|nr:hypothetical protein CIB48_g11417 [Xylaria polymorpha]
MPTRPGLSARASAAASGRKPPSGVRALDLNSMNEPPDVDGRMDAGLGRAGLGFRILGSGLDRANRFPFHSSTDSARIAERRRKTPLFVHPRASIPRFALSDRLRDQGRAQYYLPSGRPPPRPGMKEPSSASQSSATVVRTQLATCWALERSMDADACICVGDDDDDD